MTIFKRENIFWAIIGLLGATLLFFSLFGGIATAFTEVINDTFEDYVLESSPHGTNGWQGPTCGKIKGDVVFAGAKSLLSYNCSLTNIFVGGPTKTGNISFALYIPDTYSAILSLYNGATQKTYFYFENKGTYIDFQWWLIGSGWQHGFNIDENTWYESQIIFDNDTGFHAIIQVGDQNTTTDILAGQEDTEIDRFTFGSTDFYVDNFGIPPVVEADIYGVSPASGSSISSEGSSFTFGWEGIDEYDLMIVGFNNRLTGISSDYLTYQIDGLVGSETTTNLDVFGIDKNGDWYFQGFLSTLTAQVIDNVFFTGQYLSETTPDLAQDDSYFLTFSIAGYETIFQMETFVDWYSINSTRYDSPTGMFLAITDIFTPIFNKIGEFGQRIGDYFDVDESYVNGYDIGKNIPVFSYYFTQISYFMGGFPFMKWVFIVILFFIGVFIFRLILKFIPFLG